MFLTRTLTAAVLLAAFMAGLGAGNVWAARRGDRVRRPVLTYAGLEVLVGLTGLALVLLGVLSLVLAVLTVRTMMAIGRGEICQPE